MSKLEYRDIKQPNYRHVGKYTPRKDAKDIVTGKAILKLLQDTCREKEMTVIVITHNSALAPMADRVIKIRNGKVAETVLNEKPMPVEEIEW